MLSDLADLCEPGADLLEKLRDVGGWLFDAELC